MNFIINPGSGPVPKGTPEQAWRNARAFLAHIDETYPRFSEQLTLTLKGPTEGGRYFFKVKHTVTGVVQDLEVHGLTDEEAKAIASQNILGAYPRQYYKGDSLMIFAIGDFLPDQPHDFRIAISSSRQNNRL